MTQSKFFSDKEDAKIHFLCITIFFTFLLYFHYKMNLNYGDDVHFMNAVRSSNGILPILFERNTSF